MPYLNGCFAQPPFERPKNYAGNRNFSPQILGLCSQTRSIYMERSLSRMLPPCSQFSYGDMSAGD